MNKLNNIALVGGTHGNERSGIQLIQQWQQYPPQADWHFNLHYVLAHPRACQQSVRFLESDLNRAFRLADLQDPQQLGYESLLAKQLNQQLGPKGAAKTDLIIDLHNTTSNMGACLMLLKQDRFNLLMGAYVKQRMPEAVVFFQDNLPEERQSFLATIGSQGVTVEVGPQAHSVLQQHTLELMSRMTRHILDFADAYQQQGLSDELLHFTYDAFRYAGEVELPTDATGRPTAIVSSAIDQHDFQPVHPGDVIMESFDGTPITWTGEDTVYPLFVNEAAYVGGKSAMTLSTALRIDCAQDLPSE
ncbi:aspartoacylase [Terasakiispira papahanaumokuakeensis]|uniref:Aspartoacylase n=1 Tax=Terasakiispira papahanaumokuakeensis TaxID=197479 RepID=A0A1E2VCU0_9GAMM|nr:aspartoacylase [Terasakiispira papahanaumokuakeensis]ODC04774.1 aspartoacylase [Terasakiispira papahanaumokuakeensis]